MMQLSLKHVTALLIKDWKDLWKNSYIIITLALPLMMAAWLGRDGIDDTALATYPITLALVIAGSFVQAAMVAEEKEKNTLRGLIMSPASTLDILIGKSALTAVTTSAVIAGSIWLSEYKLPSFPLFLLSILLGLIIFITIGTILGLLSRTVMETSVVGMPVLIIFGMGSFLKMILENDLLLTIIDYLPSEQLTFIWVGLADGESLIDIWNHLGILTIWIAVLLAIAVITYGKRRYDN